MTQRPKYRIRKVASANGDRFYPEQRGTLWGWNHVGLSVRNLSFLGEHLGKGVEYAYSPSYMSLEDAKLCIDYRIAQDNEREEIIDYP